MKLATALLSLSCLLPVCLGQEPASKVQPPKVLSLEPGELKLRELIDRCAQFLGWNILTNDREMITPAGPATVQLQTKMTADTEGSEELLASLLYANGFALTPLDEGKKLYEVINMTGPRAREIATRAVTRTPEQVMARPNLKIAVTVAVPLEHTNATIATNALRPFFAALGGANAGSLTLGNVGNMSTMLLSGMQDQVAAGIRLLKTCDVAPPAESAPAPLTERIEAIERRLAELEKKAGGKAEDR